METTHWKYEGGVKTKKIWFTPLMGVHGEREGRGTTGVFTIIDFFMLALLRRASFLTTFCGLYFSHHYTYITNYFSSWCRPSVGSCHVLHQHMSFWLVGTPFMVVVLLCYQPYARAPNIYWNYNSYSNSKKSITFFCWKILALARIWTSDLPSTKPMHSQLSYPGLDDLIFS